MAFCFVSQSWCDQKPKKIYNREAIIRKTAPLPALAPVTHDQQNVGCGVPERSCLHEVMRSLWDHQPALPTDVSTGPKKGFQLCRKRPQRTKGVKSCSEKYMVSSNFRLRWSNVNGTDCAQRENAGVTRQTHCLAVSYRIDKPELEKATNYLSSVLLNMLCI